MGPFSRLLHHSGKKTSYCTPCPGGLFLNVSEWVEVFNRTVYGLSDKPAVYHPSHQWSHPQSGPLVCVPPPPPPSNGTVLTGISVIFGCEIMLTHKSSMPGVAVSVSTQTHTFAYFLTQVLSYCPDNSFLVSVDNGCHWLKSRTWWKTDKNIWKHLYSYAVLHYSLSHHVNNNTELT